MTMAAMKTALDAQIEKSGPSPASPSGTLSIPPSHADGAASPVHAMQARLEEAVFASFSAKEQAPAPRLGQLRTVAIVIGASLGGWGLFMAGAALNLY